MASGVEAIETKDELRTAAEQSLWNVEVVRRTDRSRYVHENDKCLPAFVDVAKKKITSSHTYTLIVSLYPSQSKHHPRPQPLTPPPRGRLFRFFPILVSSEGNTQNHMIRCASRNLGIHYLSEGMVEEARPQIRKWLEISEGILKSNMPGEGESEELIPVLTLLSYADMLAGISRWVGNRPHMQRSM